MELQNKTILVTGASGGIGKALAVAFAKKGAKILVHYGRNKSGAEETLLEVKKYSSGFLYQADLMNKDHVSDMFNAIQKDTQTIDVLVNNAGDARSGDVFDDRMWNYEYQNIFVSALTVTQEFLKLASEVQRKIIYISSIYGNLATTNANFIQYSAAKAALNSLTVSLAKSLGDKVLVNAIAPGFVKTPSWEGVSEVRKQTYEQSTKIGRFIEPDEIAHAGVFLAENDAMTGQILTVDGGFSLVSMP